MHIYPIFSKLIFLFIYFSFSQLTKAATDYFNGVLLTHIYKIY